MKKVALVTGASAGFGRAICYQLIQQGYTVIGAARRREKLAKLQLELGKAFYPLALDITDKQAVEQILTAIPSELSAIEVLVNNAGLALGLERFYQLDEQDIDTMIATNIIGLTRLTRQILPRMVERNRGYIINLGSIAGHYPYPGGNVYGATKAYVQQFSLNLRADLAGTAIRVTNIEPGLCGETEFSVTRFHGDVQQAAAVYKDKQYLVPQDIANTVGWLVSLPPHMNVNRLEIMPVSQSSQALQVVKVKS